MESHINTNDVYTSLSGLNAIKATGRKDSAEGLKQVAQQFEAVFVNMMLKSMRESTKVFSEGNYISSNELDFHQQNFDDQMSLHLAQGKGLGLADVLYRQLMHQYELEQPQQADEIKTDLEKVNPNQFSSPQQFIEELLPLAKEAAAKIGADPKMLLAQSALETGWGSKIVKDSQGGNSFNLFSIKSDASWQGPVAKTATVEFKNGLAEMQQAKFRRYDSYQRSFDDYVDFLKSNPRYQNALDQAADPENFAAELQKAGYATDPNYGRKIAEILNSELFSMTLSNTQAEV
ncbi:MAG: flagellar assembly peptidoglycan hydrolase FlgJ [Pseudomonadales bacterium]|nr:flagellar assembly peptidoglycan hydrolase FlgJ [Pseudomonadales bacterium]